MVEIRSEAAQCAFITDTIASLVGTPREPPPPRVTSPLAPPAAPALPSVLLPTGGPAFASLGAGDGGALVPSSCAAVDGGVGGLPVASAEDMRLVPGGAHQPVVLPAVEPSSRHRRPAGEAAAAPAAPASTEAAVHTPDGCRLEGQEEEEESKLPVAIAAGAGAVEGGSRAPDSHDSGGVSGKGREGSNGVAGERLLRFRDIAILYRRQVRGTGMEESVTGNAVPFAVLNPLRKADTCPSSTPQVLVFCCVESHSGCGEWRGTVKAAVVRLIHHSWQPTTTCSLR